MFLKLGNKPEKTLKPPFFYRDEHERIGDIIKKYGHFLKVYSVVPKKMFCSNFLFLLKYFSNVFMTVNNGMDPLKVGIGPGIIIFYYIDTDEFPRFPQ